MAYKILGQVRPADTSNNDLYAVPADGQAVISTLHLANTTQVSARATVFVRKFDGSLAAASAANTVISQVVVAPGSPISFTIGITLAAGDTVTVQADIADTITFHAYGSEIE